jgi:hypothetical protein
MPVTADDIRQALRAVPFQPFRLHLVDQRRFEVRHRDFAMLSPKGRSLVFYPILKEGAWEVLDVAMIASIEMISDAPGATGSQAA